MIVAPCSIRTLSAIAYSNNDNLLTRAFYLRPQSMDDIVQHTAGRALYLLGIEVPELCRWGE